MKSLSRIKTIFLTILFLFNIAGLFAQQTFKYQAALPKTDSSGFYKISLQPALTAKCNNDLSDLRVLAPGNKFNPYIFGSQLPYNDQEDFIVFPQVSNLQQGDTSTVFIAENKKNLTINQLWIRLRNTSVHRTVNLSGSDDLVRWYAIRENMVLEEAGEGNKGSYEQLINFPSSTYRYYKIQIINKNREPVAVLQAGIYYRQLFQPTYVPLQIKNFRQKDSTMLSLITIRFSDAYRVNKLHLDISGSKYYKRDVMIYQVKGNNRTLLDEVTINSANPADLYLSAKTNIIELEILNGDNPPLTIKNISAYQLSQSLISYFEKGRQYYLLFGDKNALTPDYDLRFFADSLQKPLLQLTHAAVSTNLLYKINGANKKNIPDWATWVAIIIALLLLTWLTFKMTREVNKRSADEKI